MPSCTIKVCVLALRNRNPGNEWSFYLEGLHEGSTNTQANILITN